jgi:hypothetical protein
LRVLQAHEPGTRLDLPANGGASISRSLVGAGPSWSIAPEPFVSSAPALVIPIRAQTSNAGGRREIFELRVDADALVIWLDRTYLQTVLLPSLADRYFPIRTEDFHLAVVDAGDPSDVVFARGIAAGASIDEKHADTTLPLVALRRELVALPVGVEAGGAMPQAHSSIPRRRPWSRRPRGLRKGRMSSSSSARPAGRAGWWPAFERFRQGAGR